MQITSQKLIHQWKNTGWGGKAGNLWKWTMEAYDGTARVRIGGEYYYQDNRYPVSCRGYDTPSA